MRHLGRLRVLLQLTLIIPTSKVLHLLLNFLKKEPRCIKIKRTFGGMYVVAEGKRILEDSEKIFLLSVLTRVMEKNRERKLNL